jgi:hypothetical protein
VFPQGLNLNQTAQSGSKNSLDGASWGGFGSGDFYANLGGSGTSFQAAGNAPPGSIGGVSPLVLAALALGVVWLLTKH